MTRTKDCKLGNHRTIRASSEWLVPEKIICQDCGHQWDESEWATRKEWDLKVQEYLQSDMLENQATGN